MLRAWPVLLVGIVARAFGKGSPLTALRGVFGIADFAFLCAAGYRSLHDRMAGTIVVEAPR